MFLFGLPGLYALFVWWFSTGAIIYLDNLPRSTFRWTMLAATVLLGALFYELAASSTDRSVTGAYIGFTCGVLIWGWQEMSFFMGFITGPRKRACPAGCGGLRHFGHAIQTCLYHELAILIAAAAVMALTWHAPNQVGTWTFMLLWGMRQSAKLNVFLGVLNLNEEFLPEHIGFLKGFLTRKPMNLLFPVSVTVGTVTITILMQKALAAGADPAHATGLTFLSTMLALAILEHWFLVLPLPFAELWSWVLRKQPRRPSFEASIVTGRVAVRQSALPTRDRAIAGRD